MTKAGFVRIPKTIADHLGKQKRLSEWTAVVYLLSIINLHLHAAYPYGPPDYK